MNSTTSFTTKSEKLVEIRGMENKTEKNWLSFQNMVESMHSYTYIPTKNQWSTFSDPELIKNGLCSAAD